MIFSKAGISNLYRLYHLKINWNKYEKLEKGAIIIMVIAAISVGYFQFESLKFNNYVLKAAPEKGMKIPINEEAPIIAKSSIEINTPIEKVWTILTEVQSWPDWQTEVTEVYLSGSLKEGSFFTWKAGGLHFKSKIHTMEPLKHFGWTGETFGAMAVHNWKFEEKGGSTHVFVGESLQDVFPTLFRGYFQRNLKTGMDRNLEELYHVVLNNRIES
jgi:uncharacterized protein YndB with AHSA1/START domain